MAQFIYLSLLAATIQLPLVSVTYVPEWLINGTGATFKVPEQWTYTQCCRDDFCECLPNCKNGSTGSTNSSCYVHMRNTACLHRKVKADCSESHFKQVDLSELSHGHPCKHRNSTEADCRKLCTENLTCQFFTFDKSSNECFLMSSSDEVLIQHNYQTVSGYPLRTCYRDINASLQFHQEHKSWIDALEHCHSQNSSLVQITTQTVQDAVNCLLLTKTDRMQDGVWIGLERSIFGYHNDPWMWTSGPQAKFSQWNGSFPVDRLNNHCGKIIWVEESKFKWLDADCHEELPFICGGLNERPHGNSVTPPDKDPT